MKLTLSHAESALLEYIIDFYYEKYSSPPFEDIEDRFHVVMDPVQNIVKAADRQTKRREARERGDFLYELGFYDTPEETEGFVPQLRKAEFFSMRGLMRRWFNGLQYSLYCRARFIADEERTLADYWERDNRSPVLLVFSSLEEDAERTLYLEPVAVEDLRAVVHLLCDFVPQLTPLLIQQRATEKAKRLAGTEEPVDQEMLAVEIRKADSQNELFHGALKPLVDKFLTAYRKSKFHKAL